MMKHTQTYEIGQVSQKGMRSRLYDFEHLAIWPSELEVLHNQDSFDEWLTFVGKKYTEIIKAIPPPSPQQGIAVNYGVIFSKMGQLDIQTPNEYAINKAATRAYIENLPRIVGNIR